MKILMQILLLSATLFFLNSCTKEYTCQCTATDLTGAQSTSLSTIESKSRAAAQVACEAGSVDIIFASTECTLIN